MRKAWQYKHVDLLKLNNEISEFQWESYLWNLDLCIAVDDFFVLAIFFQSVSGTDFPFDMGIKPWLIRKSYLNHF
jgi:hypothetical protein